MGSQVKFGAVSGLWRAFLLCLSLVASALLSVAAAASDAVPLAAAATPVAAVALAAPATPTDGKPAKQQGWKHKLILGATGAFSRTSNVVGAVDGSTTQVGLIVDGSSDYISGVQEWMTAYKIVQAQSQTPLLSQFFKSADSFDIASTFTHRFADLSWAGPYARAKASTSLFAGYIVKPTASLLKKAKTDGSTELEAIAAQERSSRTTSAFEPLLLGESAGLFSYPLESKTITVKASAGAATQQILTQDGYASADDAKTPEIELKQLRSSTQIGGEFELSALGEIEPTTSWKLKANLFMPLYTNGGPALALTGVDALSTDLSAALSIKLAKWASLDYILTAKRIPLVLDKWQVQNGLMLTTSFGLL